MRSKGQRAFKITEFQKIKYQHVYTDRLGALFDDNSNNCLLNEKEGCKLSKMFI